ncbi:MAG: hypothetical protein AAFX05_05835 [Planctomycetota bacterium]
MSDQKPTSLSGKAGSRRLSTKMLLFTGSNWMRVVLTMVVGFITVPILLSEFGAVLYGVFVLLTQLTYWFITPLRTAMQQTVLRELTKAISTDDHKGLQSALTNGICITGMFATLMLLIGAGLVYAVGWLNIPEEHLFRARVVVICETIFLAQFFLSGPFRALYLASHRVIQMNIDQVLQRSADLIAALLALVLPVEDSFIAFVVCRLSIHCLNTLYRVTKIAIIMPSARLAPRMISRTTIRAMMSTGAWSLANPLSRMAYYFSDHLLLNIFFGPVFNTIYSLARQLVGHGQRFGSQVAGGIEAIAADLHETGRKASTTALMLTSMRYSCSVTVLCAVVVGVFTQPILEAWLGKQLSADEELAEVLPYGDAIVLAWQYAAILLLGGVISETQIAATRVLYGMGLIRSYSPALLTGAITKVVLSIAAIGIGTAVVADAPPQIVLLLPAVTLLCQIGIYGIFMPILLSRVTEVSFLQLNSHAYLRPMIAVVPTLILSVTIVMNVESWNLLNLAMWLMVVGASYLPMGYFVAMLPNERKRVKEVLRRGPSGLMAAARSRKRGPAKTDDGAMTDDVSDAPTEPAANSPAQTTGGATR